MKRRRFLILLGGYARLFPSGDYAALQQMAGPRITLERFRNDFPALLGRCHLSLSQGGYNTMLDLCLTVNRLASRPKPRSEETIV